MSRLRLTEAQVFVRGATADVLNYHGYGIIEVGSTDEALAVLADCLRGTVGGR
jgi:hypothetical protein